MKARLLAWCREQGLLAQGGPVLVALSGGADSVALLHLLWQAQEQLQIELHAAHFNHQLRGAESDGDAAFCQSLCQGWGIPLHTGGASVADYAADHGLGVEEAARQLRYAFLQQVCHGGAIATGHNADDNLETLLLHLLRGCGLRGLGGIPPRRGNIVRPLLWATREEIEAYLARHGLSYREDSSNGAEAYLRNRLRHQVLPILRREAPAISQRTLETALWLREDEAHLARQAQALLDGAACPGGWDAASLLAAPRPLRLRALEQLLRQGGGHDLTRTHLEAAEGLLTNRRPGARLAFPGVCLRRSYALLATAPPAEAAEIPPQQVPQPGRLTLPDGQVLVCEMGQFQPGSLDYPRELALNPALVQTLGVRSRRQGDRLRGPGGEKLLRRRMMDCKIPADRRMAVPVLTCGSQVVAALGVGADPHVRAAPGEALLLRLEPAEKE